MNPDWTPLLRVDDCPVGSRRYVATEGRELAVFHLADPDRFVVIDNACPHASGNLSAGDLENGREIICPWHFWAFDLDSGECVMNDAIKLNRYDCKVEDGRLFAKLSRPPRHRIDG
ncbi:MAG: Rieske (2Fe-2S) protein [Phycisphaerales bacterium]|nr:Rieske (2Fe-2S) protein [Phycisphaerales bacterium]